VTTNVVSGADSLDRYIGGRGGVSGAVVLGRVANRIAGARFTIDGVEYKVTAMPGRIQSTVAAGDLPAWCGRGRRCRSPNMKPECG